MPKILFNSALAGMRGTLDGFVYKHYKKDKRGHVVSRVPDMSNVVPSAAQLARREKMREAGEFHRRVLADPHLKKNYQRTAKQRGINLPAARRGGVPRKK